MTYTAPPLEISMSVGFAVHNNSSKCTIESLLSLADKEMYKNKQKKKVEK